MISSPMTTPQSNEYESASLQLHEVACYSGSRRLSKVIGREMVCQDEEEERGGGGKDCWPVDAAGRWARASSVREGGLCVTG